jgi:putative CocE/NonD family hydrolase
MTQETKEPLEVGSGRDVVREVGLDAVMPDGVRLVADAWHPAEGGPWPVLLQRLPYGRSVASAPVLPHPSWLARRGYAVVVQDVRGRGDSGGRFLPFVNEAEDGVATVEWAARLPFSNGDVATYGFSYQGLMQVAVAARRPPALKAIAPMMCCSDPYEGWTYEGGCLRWPFVAFWAAQLAGQEKGVAPLVPNLEALPISDALGNQPPAWFTEWLDHPEDDAYWAERRPDLHAIEVPAFSVLGWFDDFSSGTSRIIEALGAEAVCGPWQHMPWGTRLADVEMGEEAGPLAAHHALVGFFDRVLKGEGESPSARVRYYSVGRGWTSAPSWPPPHRLVEWSATSGGAANSRHGDGRLIEGRADPGLSDVFVAEPLVPYPGSLIPLATEAAAEDRRDVLCYTSAPLASRLSIAGSPRVDVTTRCDRDAHDVVASLVLVDPAGEPRALSTGVRRARVSPGRPCRLSVELRPIAWTCPAGSRLRLDVSGARFPAFDRNPHDATVSPARAQRDAFRVATIELLEARIGLPVEAGS